MTQRTHSSTPEPIASTSTAAHDDSSSSATAPTSEPTTAEQVARLTDRRGVLRVAGVVAGAGALAACSSPPVPEASSAAGGTPTSEVPVGGGKIYADTKTVVTQPTAGSFKAFDTTCPHQGCAVASFEGSQIVCPCHGSHFDMTTGDRVSGPAATGLTPKTVTVTGATFTVG